MPYFEYLSRTPVFRIFVRTSLQRETTHGWMLHLSFLLLWDLNSRRLDALQMKHRRLVFSLITLGTGHCLGRKQVDSDGFGRGWCRSLAWLLGRYGVIRDAVEDSIQFEPFVRAEVVLILCSFEHGQIVTDYCMFIVVSHFQLVGLAV